MNFRPRDRLKADDLNALAEIPPAAGHVSSEPGGYYRPAMPIYVAEIVTEIGAGDYTVRIQVPMVTPGTYADDPRTIDAHAIDDETGLAVGTRGLLFWYPTQAILQV